MNPFRYTFGAQVLAIAWGALVAVAFAGGTGCNLSAAQWSGIAKGALTFACADVVPYIPNKNPALASTICKGAVIGADALGDIIEGAIDAPPPGARIIQPQGEIANVPATCAGGIVTMVPPGIVAKVQAGLDKRPECKR